MKPVINVAVAASMFFFAAGCHDQEVKQSDMETNVTEAPATVKQAVSKDGTVIAYETRGTGPVIILVNGALADRKIYGENELAYSLSHSFTVIFYDRRGRGESSDTKPYSVAREIEDIEALINAAGDSAYLFGSSSGAALSLLAAERLGATKVKKLALYEPPFGSGDKASFAGQKQKINELVAAGKPADAISFFMESIGTPPDKLKEMKSVPGWNDQVRIGHTLVYDFEVLGDGTIPVDVAKRITIPTLVMNGDKSFEFMAATADAVAKHISGAKRRTLKDQMHNPTADALAPVLLEFFNSAGEGN